jgi:hypothetical protein
MVAEEILEMSGIALLLLAFLCVARSAPRRDLRLISQS